MEVNEQPVEDLEALLFGASGLLLVEVSDRLAAEELQSLEQDELGCLAGLVRTRRSACDRTRPALARCTPASEQDPEIEAVKVSVMIRISEAEVAGIGAGPGAEQRHEVQSINRARTIEVARASDRP